MKRSTMISLLNGYSLREQWFLGVVRIATLNFDYLHVDDVEDLFDNNIGDCLFASTIKPLAIQTLVNCATSEDEVEVAFSWNKACLLIKQGDEYYSAFECIQIREADIIKETIEPATNYINFDKVNFEEVDGSIISSFDNDDDFRVAEYWEKYEEYLSMRKVIVVYEGIND